MTQWALAASGDWNLTTENWTEDAAAVTWVNDGSRTAAFSASHTYTLQQPVFAAGLQGLRGTFNGGIDHPLHVGPGGIHTTEHLDFNETQ